VWTSEKTQAIKRLQSIGGLSIGRDVNIPGERGRAASLKNRSTPCFQSPLGCGGEKKRERKNKSISEREKLTIKIACFSRLNMKKAAAKKSKKMKGKRFAKTEKGLECSMKIEIYQLPTHRRRTKKYVKTYVTRQNIQERSRFFYEIGKDHAIDHRLRRKRRKGSG